MRINKFSGCTVLSAAIAFSTLLASLASAQQEVTLYSFGGTTTDAAIPYGNLLFDAAGNLYGTTGGGGAFNQGGTVYELSPHPNGRWTEKVLYSFGGYSTDGLYPSGGLVFDAAGNLYGVTYYGGANGDGAVFELSPTGSGNWTEAVIHSFDQDDGYGPNSGLIFDVAGNLYGTTYSGGAFDGGTLFELSPAGGGAWTLSLVHSFGEGLDGVAPVGSVVADASGNLYGSTNAGGTHGVGIVYELVNSGGGVRTEEILHECYTNTNGSNPQTGPILDASGNLYGGMFFGGTYGNSIVYELRHTASGGWVETVLYSFNANNGASADSPEGLVLDASGNLYGGTTEDVYEVFELKRAGKGAWPFQVLHQFDSAPTNLILDASGNVYGTTPSGGTYGGGVVFEIKH